MESDGLLPDARTAVEVLSDQLSALLRELPSAEARIEDSEWSRLSQWTAIALGLMSASGRHPELAAHFGALFHRF
jgi:hypothetical protein